MLPSHCRIAGLAAENPVDDRNGIERTHLLNVGQRRCFEEFVQSLKREVAGLSSPRKPGAPHDDSGDSPQDRTRQIRYLTMCGVLVVKVVPHARPIWDDRARGRIRKPLVTQRSQIQSVQGMPL